VVFFNKFTGSSGNFNFSVPMCPSAEDCNRLTHSTTLYGSGVFCYDYNKLMDLRSIQDSQKNQYNGLVNHIIQSWQWGEARKSLGTKVARFGIYQDNKLSKAFQLTFHKIPLISKYVGYLPKGPSLDNDMFKALKQIGQEYNCAFIKIEPNIEVSDINYTFSKGFIKSPKPLFTKFNFVLDLTKSEDELLKRMHPKTRYNIRVAEKHRVKVEKRDDDMAFDIYLKLYFETAKRQNYHGHNGEYHRKIWENLKKEGLATLLIASYKNKFLTAWMLLKFKDTLFYPYGGSSAEYREVMANNLVAWEAIKFGKKMGLKKFDMWGAANFPNPNKNDPFYGFHQFKKGYGGKLVEYIGTYDLVLNWPIYLGFTFVNQLMPLKLFLLKLLNH
jgi:lipid II:glycine glycyltransferase (peptidoglycan interpeptide bridge formation enzyme)